MANKRIRKKNNNISFFLFTKHGQKLDIIALTKKWKKLKRSFSMSGKGGDPWIIIKVNRKTIYCKDIFHYDFKEVITINMRCKL